MVTIRGIVISFIAVNCIFLLNLHLYPFIDLPNHLAEATTYKFYGEEGNVLHQYYKPSPWYFPNTFHTVFCSLFPSVELGNKVFIILYIVLLQLSMFLIIRELNGNPWYGFLTVLFTYNFNLTYGFVGYTISIPTIFITFYFLIRDFNENKFSLKLIVSMFLAVIFLMHAQNALFALLLLVTLSIYRYRTAIKKLLITSILIPLPLLVMIFSWWFARNSQNEPGTARFLLSYYKNDYLDSMPTRLRLVFFDNFQIADGLPGLILAFLFSLTVLLPFIHFKPWKKIPVKTWLSGNVIYIAIFFFLCLSCYLFLPDTIPGEPTIAERFCTFVMLSFILLASTWLRYVDSVKLKYFVTVTAAFYLFFWFEYLYTFNIENKNFDSKFFNGLENKAKLTGLIYDNEFRGRKVYIHFPNYFIVWNRGIATTRMIDYRFGVVRRVASESHLPVYQEHVGDHYKHISTSRLDYVLVRGEAPVPFDTNLINFDLIRKSDEWLLYGNTSSNSLGLLMFSGRVFRNDITVRASSFREIHREYWGEAAHSCPYKITDHLIY